MYIIYLSSIRPPSISGRITLGRDRKRMLRKRFAGLKCVPIHEPVQIVPSHMYPWMSRVPFVQCLHFQIMLREMLWTSWMKGGVIRRVGIWNLRIFVFILALTLCIYIRASVPKIAKAHIFEQRINVILPATYLPLRRVYTLHSTLSKWSHSEHKPKTTIEVFMPTFELSDFCE